MIPKDKKAPRSVYESSIYVIANFVAVGVAFFATGPIYTATIEPVLIFTQQQYGPTLIVLVKPFWWVLIAGLTFGVARASVATLIMVGGLALANKLF